MKYDKKIIVIVIAIAIVLVAITKCTYGIIENAKINIYNVNNATIGIDVSEHQGEIDWVKVRKENIKFAFIRVGYRAAKTGIMNEDKYYQENIEGAIKEKIPVGVYFFSQAVTTEEAKEEADFVIKKIAKYDITYEVAFDMESVYGKEDRIYGLSTEEKTEIANSFCKKIKSAGYIPMIYGNEQWLLTSYNMKELKKYNIWYAWYSKEPNSTIDFKIWQYTNEGKVNGIDGDVDCDYYFK